MGALHEGHLALIRRAKALVAPQAGHVGVSIFVNPAQFGVGEDLDRYPRPTARDLELCRAEAVDLAFVPSVDAVYPPDEREVVVDVPDLTQVLEGAHRPDHFVGVCRVVAKLLAIVQPTVACFGQKDYQQLKVIQAMTQGLCLPVQIEPCPTVREADNLALSSRNTHLDAESRRHAVSLYKALAEAKRLIEEQGEVDPGVVERAMAQEMQMHHVAVDYAAVRDARTLGELDVINPTLEPIVCLVAGRIGGVRLIDNLVIGG